MGILPYGQPGNCIDGEVFPIPICGHTGQEARQGKAVEELTHAPLSAVYPGPLGTGRDFTIKVVVPAKSIDKGRIPLLPVDAEVGQGVHDTIAA